MSAECAEERLHSPAVQSCDIDLSDEGRRFSLHQLAMSSAGPLEVTLDDDLLSEEPSYMEHERGRAAGHRPWFSIGRSRSLRTELVASSLMHRRKRRWAVVRSRLGCC